MGWSAARRTPRCASLIVADRAVVVMCPSVCGATPLRNRTHLRGAGLRRRKLESRDKEELRGPNERSCALISSRRARRVVVRRPQDPGDGRLSRMRSTSNAQLGPLLGDAVAARDVATIARAPDGSLSLSLADSSGQPIGARTLPPARTCSEQAKAVAVTLAVWEAQLHPEISLGLDRLAPEPPPPGQDVAVIARAAPAPAPAFTRASWRWAWRPWVIFSRAGGRRALGWSWGSDPTGARWRARLAAVGVGRHRLDLPPGSVSWWRAFVQLGADVDVARGRRWAVVHGRGRAGRRRVNRGRGLHRGPRDAQHRSRRGGAGPPGGAPGPAAPLARRRGRRVGAPPSPGNSRGRDQLGACHASSRWRRWGRISSGDVKRIRVARQSTIGCLRRRCAARGPTPVSLRARRAR